MMQCSFAYLPEALSLVVIRSFAAESSYLWNITPVKIIGPRPSVFLEGGFSVAYIFSPLDLSA